MRTRELQGLHSQVKYNVQGMRAEIERKYKNDPIGMKMMLTYLLGISQFTDEIEVPLLEAVDLYDMCDLRGVNHFTVERLERTASLIQVEIDKRTGCKTSKFSIVRGKKDVS